MDELRSTGTGDDGASADERLDRRQALRRLGLLAGAAAAALVVPACGGGRMGGEDEEEEDDDD